MNIPINYQSPPAPWRARLLASSLAAGCLALLPLPSLAQNVVPPVPPGVPAPAPLGGAAERTFKASHIQGPMLTDILPVYEALIDKKIIVESTITDAVTMTINTQQLMTREEAIRYYEDSFLINGFAILPVDNRTVKFVNVAQRRPEGEGKVVIYRRDLEGRIYHLDDEGRPDYSPIPDIDDTVGYVMKLDNISADEASRTFQLYTGSTTGGYIPAPDGTSIIITESGRVIRALIELQKDIDKARGILRQEAIQLERANAEEVASSINQILQEATSQRQRTGGAGAPRAAAAPLATTTASNAAAEAAAAAPLGTAEGQISALPDAQNVHIHPIARTNRVLVIARPVDFAYIRGLVEIFDAPNVIDNFLKRELKYLPVLDFMGLAQDAINRYQDGVNAQTGGSGGTRTSNTTNRSTGLTNNNRNSTTRNSSNFGNTGGGIGGGAGGSSLGGGTGLSGGSESLGAPQSTLIGNTLLIADSQLNNIIVSGPPEHLRIIDQLLDEVDVRPRQVYISAVIAQVELNDDIRFGMDILRTVDDIDIGGEKINIAGLYQTTTGGGTILDPSTLQTVADFTQTPGGFSAWLSVGNFLNAYIEALENTSQFQVISRPFVFTANNQEASINSGQEVAVPTSTQSSLTNSDSINSSIGYREVLLELSVLPLINSSDEVTLEIAQRNQNIANFVEISGNNVPNISTQSLNTKVRLPNRGIVVLGGIIQEEDRETVNGLPLLSKIPLIKRLTGSSFNQKVRRELLIFIQPHIIEGSTDLIDANIEKVSPTFVGEAALEAGKPEPDVDSALFPDIKKRGRIFPLKQRDTPMDEENSSYEEPALPQRTPELDLSLLERPARPGKVEEKGRKKLFNFKFNDREKATEPEPQEPKKTKRGLFGRRK